MFAKGCEVLVGYVMIFDKKSNIIFYVRLGIWRGIDKNVVDMALIEGYDTGVW